MKQPLSQKELFQQQIEKITGRLTGKSVHVPPVQAAEEKQYTVNGTQQCAPVSPSRQASSSAPAGEAAPGQLSLLSWIIWGFVLLLCLGMLVYFFLWPFCTRPICPPDSESTALRCSQISCAFNSTPYENTKE